MDEYEKQYNSIQNNSIDTIELAYDETIRKVSRILIGVSSAELFLFSKHIAIDSKVNSYIRSQFLSVNKMIEVNTSKAFDLSNLKNDELTKKLFERHSLKVPKNIIYHNPDKLSEFLNKKIDGLTFSDRVWNLSGQFKSELESSISAAFTKGLSEDQLAAEIKKYLKDPDVRFKRIRDKFGELKPSKRQLSYNPGRGIYKSSQKNAVRLAREVINSGMREAEFENFKNNPFVTAFDVRNTERSVTTCKLCEQNAGRYPKTFRFPGWHIGCMCSSYPVFCSDADFMGIYRKLFT